MAAATRAVVAALSARGTTVRFVGGCVRDALLRRQVVDIDIATPDTPPRVLRLLGQAGVRAIPTGIAYGTITAIIGEEHFEVTTLRRDVEAYGRRAKVAFTDDWIADAERRDFTINALYLDDDGTLYDPMGGLADLRAGRVRFVGEPAQRIVEDVLRILRFFRFHAWYGRGPPDPIGLAACRRHAERLRELSGERVAGELLRLLDAPDPAAALALMGANGVLAPILPEAGNLRRLRRLCRIEAASGGGDPLRRLGAALATDGACAAAVAARLRLSNKQRARLVTMVAPPIAVDGRSGARKLRVALYRLGRDALRDAVLLAWARSARGDTRFRAMLSNVATWPVPALPVRGRDVKALGIASGPAIGALLGAAEARWIERDFRSDRAELLAWIRALTATA